MALHRVPVADRGLVTLTTSPVADRGLLTFFARSKKVSKERPLLVSRHWRGGPVLLDEPGGCGTRSRYEKTHLNVRELKQSSPNSPARLCYSAAYKGSISEQRSDARNGVIVGMESQSCYYFCSTTSPNHQFTTLRTLGTPCKTPSSRRQGRELGEDCLSARSFNVSFHCEREFHSRRPCRAAQGHHASGGLPGRPSLW